jgi:hypothetical protein
VLWTLSSLDMVSRLDIIVLRIHLYPSRFLNGALLAFASTNLSKHSQMRNLRI